MEKKGEGYMFKKIVMVVTALLFVCSGPLYARHKDHKDMDKGKWEMMKGKMMDGKMMDRKIVATSDGGVVIVCCGKMMKYDKDLNLVKTVELHMDMGEKMCPMMDKDKKHDHK